MSKHFTRVEAEAKVGKKIRTTVAWSGVERGTTGRVVEADQMGYSKPAGSKDKYEVWDVVIEWDLPTESPAILTGEIAGESVTLIRTGKPLVDWFTKEEYEQYLTEEF